MAGDRTLITYSLHPGKFWRATTFVFFRNPRSWRSLLATSLVVTIIVGLVERWPLLDYFVLFLFYALLLLGILLVCSAFVARRAQVTRSRTVRGLLDLAGHYI
jgi:hypothetical protein